MALARRAGRTACTPGIATPFATSKSTLMTSAPGGIPIAKIFEGNFGLPGTRRDPKPSIETSSPRTERVTSGSPTSIVLLSVGKLMAGESSLQADSAVADLRVAAGASAASGSVRVVLGVGAGCLAGAMFAMLSTVIRFTATARVPVATIVFVITGMGVVSLGSLSAQRLGPEVGLSV